MWLNCGDYWGEEGTLAEWPVGAAAGNHTSGSGFFGGRRDGFEKSSCVDFGWKLARRLVGAANIDGGTVVFIAGVTAFSGAGSVNLLTGLDTTDNDFAYTF